MMFSFGDNEEDDVEITDVPPAPEAPTTGRANVVGSTNVFVRSINGVSEEQEILNKIKNDLEAEYPRDTEVGYIPNSEIVTPDEAVAHQMRMLGEGKYKKARRFHADTPFVLGVLLFLVAAMAGASFYVSFSGLFAAAAWAVGNNPPLQMAVPIMLDVAIIAFTLSLFVERERGDKVRWTWLAIGAFAAVSAVANILHTFVVSTATDNYQLIVGSVISGGAPVLLAFATDKIAVKVFKSADPVEK